jgi:glycosyltransferase involved in cell wall biosynthesis
MCGRNRECIREGSIERRHLVNVLQVGKFYDPYRGGMETALKNLCDGLRPHVNLHVLVANTSTRTVHEQRGVPVTRVASLGTLFSSSVIPSFPLWLHKTSADIVHLHMPNPAAEISYLMAGLNRPLIAHFHSDIVRQRMLLRAYAPILERFYRKASCILAPTPNHIKFSPFVSRFHKKCHVVPFGIALSRFDLTETLRAKVRRLHSSPPAVLFVGRLVYYKGIEYLIHAVRELRVQLWIAGTGPLGNRLRQLAAQLRLQEKVKFLGDVPEEDLPAYLHACDVLVLPSITNSEMFGMVQLEAMACRKPVISTDLPTGVPWVNRHAVTGFVVPPRDPAALARAIAKLLESRSLREDMGDAGRSRVEAEFTSTRMVQRVLDIYRSLLN